MGETAELSNSVVSSRIAVTGIDCPDCAARVEKAVKRMPGVAAASIAFPLGKLNVEYDSTQTGIQQVLEKVKALGCEAKEEAGTGAACGSKTTTIRIGGMDCADCAAKLEKRIAKVPGVAQAQVNFGASKMIVVHQGPLPEILTTIEKMGYFGRIDEGHDKQPEPVSFWKTNQYAIPTVISFVMLIFGVISERLDAPLMFTNTLFLAGIILGGFLMAKNGISVLINARELDMNVLMTIAVVGAAAIGEFEEAASVVFLFSLGNALQGYTLDKTRNSIRGLMELTPNEALVSRNGVEVTLPVEEIGIDDVIICRPGERIPMDGKVVQGFSSVNQSPITGESLPVEKSIGDEVYAGTINERGSLEIMVTKLAKDNTISRIIDMVEEAQGQRAPSQQFVDKFAKYYTPLVVMGAALVAVVPPLAFGQPFYKWFYQAMAMLLVACPCALVISTPVSIVSAIGSAARRGVLIKGGIYLEEAGALSVVAFDKTGTLTVGKPRVTDVFTVNDCSEQEIIAIAAAIESRSEHPLGEAILDYAREKGIKVPQVANFEAIPGKGAKGDVEGRYYQIGNPRLLAEKGLGPDKIADIVAGLQSEGKTAMLLGDMEKIIGVIAVADVLRDNTKQAVESLKKAGIQKAVMLTGDNSRTAQAIATKAGIDEFQADLLPEEKVSRMKDLLAQYGKVAMVGDGVNDAPAMAISTVGIAMGTAGSDAALETADIALMADDLTKLSYAMRLSRKTLRIIKQNIAFALLVKGLILLMVIPGWLTLWLAVAGDMGSSLLVTLNGMRLLKVKHQA
ncbi:cadmium-translocating P-type ATPase [Pelotomaculum terephthalicicum JT]|uniref:heavy metal translocating P-type ATPase n=1 Tax=Pelotomaculum TaxID=191373 RepID=UPI0009C7B291|nr:MULTISPECIES: heavy metal translocating P-type ATPase [Pelotomaculum]MCG9969418.1 cadmium-translocating P-type ATPase [Pelotomaculum terephthalicicum JT]OPX91532.1 MAG: putative cadmium-transporting ATPase [Pelotomaculum sp. PtaB.Bin117]OPY63776.1 MAG: putative cadmium-transporting ATPase [Pelotomaculum sp. PtaU1.Bin065]